MRPSEGVQHFYGDAAWRFWSSAIWAGIVLAILLILCGVGEACWPRFLNLAGLSILMGQWARLLLLVPPMVMIVASGGIDFSIGGVAALVGVLIAKLAPETGLAFALAAGMSAALIVGVTNGLLIGLARVHWVFVMFGMTWLIRSMARIVAQDQTILVGPELAGSLSSPWLLALLAALSVAAGVVLVYLTPVGRRADSHGSWAARMVFVGTPYALSSLMAGVYGALLLGRLRTAEPAPGFGLELGVVLVVVVGGTVLGGGVGNPIAGVLAALAVVCAESMAVWSGVASAVGTAISGAALLVFALLSTLYFHLCDRRFRRSRAAMAPEQEEASPGLPSDA